RHTRFSRDWSSDVCSSDLARRVRPHDVCLVPERRAEVTTEGGLDVAGKLKRVARVCRELGDAGIRVSLFIDAEKRQIDAARAARSEERRVGEEWRCSE